MKPYLEVKIKTNLYTDPKVNKDGKVIEKSKILKRNIITRICVDVEGGKPSIAEVFNNKGEVIKNECKVILKDTPTIVNESFDSLKKRIYGEDKKKTIIGFKYKNRK